MNSRLLLICGNSNKPLAEEIAVYLQTQLSNALVTKFSEGETRVKINEDVRGSDVFVIQPTSPPTNDMLMELLIMIDALRRSSADRITAVVPYFGYARQDRKDQPRVPITAKLVANLITEAGADRVLTMDLHAGQIQGFFDIPLDHLYAVNVFADYFEKKKLQDLAIVAPDVGGIKMARAYAKRFGSGLAICDKRRIDDQTAEVMNILGDVKGKNVLMVDDICATAGSLCEAAEGLRQNGAKRIYAAISHAVLSGPAIDRINKSCIEELIVTNSINGNRAKDSKKIRVLSIASLMGEAIRRIHHSESISVLFD